MNTVEIANQLKDIRENIVLVYAFNATGKTQLSVAYKDETKSQDTGQHTGVYYNAYSEDLFVWDNDTENGEKNICLTINHSSLNRFHGLLSEDAIREKLTPYKPKYNFYFKMHGNTEEGIEAITFFIEGKEDKPIKISRGEERTFIWCYFLALFEVEGWADQQNAHFFIDDPVSSLDDHNIFVTAATMYELIESQHQNRKIIITTHHIGLFSILADWLTKGEKSDYYRKHTHLFILNRTNNTLSLETPRNNVFLYHLHLLKTLEYANREKLFTYHFALLRQVLENIASFLGVGQFGYVLDQIGYKNTDDVARIVNALAHRNVYYYQTETMNPDNEELFKDIFEKLKSKYQFILHAD